MSISTVKAGLDDIATAIRSLPIWSYPVINWRCLLTS